MSMTTIWAIFVNFRQNFLFSWKPTLWLFLQHLYVHVNGFDFSPKRHFLSNIFGENVLKNHNIGPRCIAGSRNRYIASLPAKLRIAHLSDFESAGDKTEVIEAFFGNDVVIRCKVPDSIPPPFVQVCTFSLVNNFISSVELEHTEM
jgi:hypothetical protein